ncbi:MAG: putative undecaprenyl-diphosphatase YbjG [candidate division WS2 bacterium]|uniref:Undecaprenyl-diphosphatase YbjG n=1 Tax=Psychracetigena formicireducens TaxID=2986056 RepID=A0A9E2F2G5_PSYF1|nr:putative undecaprenyl-diphosphatase YbjG [Candidatus Psychracetigena formicireducens]MBT9145647.1 putative undecaprenyl-diphosphatase YbjG [Candidatus Psychracetigena formicireducens]
MIEGIREFLLQTVPAGTEAIIYLQGFRNALLDRLFLLITFLGDGEFYLFLFLVVYLSVNKHWGRGLAYILLISTYINLLIKDVIALPRPYDSRITILRSETSYSFPSDHSQVALSTYGFFGLRVNKWSVWLVFIPLILLIGLSRVYIGVHYPQDLLGGWLSGLFILIIWEGMQHRIKNIPPLLSFILAIILPLLLMVLFYSRESLKTMATLMGVSLGFQLEKALVDFEADGLLLQKIVRILVALPIIATVWYGLKIILPDLSIFVFIRHLVLGFTVSFFIPSLLSRLKLVKKRNSLTWRNS